jgi:uncharacterized cupin superfamily protein
MPHEATMEATEHGRVPADDGWFVLNARDARWYDVPGSGRFTSFEGDDRWPTLGFGVHILAPGENMALYHGDELHEVFLLLSGQATALIEGEERPLRQWDLVNCPPWTEHIVIGAGSEPAVFICASNRLPDGKVRYPVSELAARFGASVREETDDPREAYDGLPRPVPARCRDEDLA